MVETITYKMEFTFPKESILGFAKFLGYTETVRTVEPNESGVPVIIEVSNPENAFDFVLRMAKAHNEQFATSWANFLVQRQVDISLGEIQPYLESQIVEPVKQAIQISYSEGIK